MRGNRYSRTNTKKRSISKMQRHFKKVFYLIIVLILFFAVFKFGNKIINNKEDILTDSPISYINNTENTVTASSDNSQTETKKNTTISLSVIGDIMCHNTQYMDAYNKSINNYDFSYVFEDIKYYIQTADLAIGNLETTFSAPKYQYSGYPTFNSPEALANNLKDIGLDMVSTANNHCFDKGYFGIESTIDYLDKAGISHTGTFKSNDDQNTISIINVKGIKMAFLSFTYGTNGITIPQDKNYSVNLINEDLMLQQINLAKEQSPDVICVNMHWGIEYQTNKNSTQDQLTNFLFKNGVDLILGSHPHVLQSMEIKDVTLDDGTTKKGFVIYSLGNFMSGQVKQNTKNSIILQLQLTKNADTSKVSIDSANYVPIYMYKSSSSLNAYKILDIEKSIEKYETGEKNIDQSTYNTLKSELVKIKNTVGNKIVN